MLSIYDIISKIINEDVHVGSSDKSLYKRLAQHKWNHISAAAREKLKKKYPGIPKNVNKLIKWFRESNGRLVPDELEIIKRDDWNQLEHIGEIENSLMSPHKWTYFDYICKNPSKKNKILVVLECSNSKPYCQDNAKKWYFSRLRSFCDFACGAYGIVPEEYSQLYPVRHDEWAHSDESESVAFKYNLISCNRGYQYIKASQYEKVIVFFQNPAPEEFMKWMKNMPHMKDKLIFVVDKGLRELIKKNHPGLAKSEGLVTQRLMLMPETHIAIINALKKCLEGDELERLKELEKLVKDDDKNGQKKWIEKTNAEFDIKPYETHEPGWECKLNKSEIPYHTYDSEVEDKIVKEYCDWLKDWAEKQNKKEITDNTDYYKERILFTPLDLLIDMYKLGPENPNKQDIDKLYWNMMTALEKMADKLGFERLNLDKYGRYRYLWIYKHAFDHMSRKEFIEIADEIGLSQFKQNVLKR